MTVVIRLRERCDEHSRDQVFARLARAGLVPTVHSPTLLSTSGPLDEIRAAVAELYQVVDVAKLAGDYPLAGKPSQARKSRVRLGEWEIGATNFAVIAGPCSVETTDQMMRTARAVRDAGAHALRGGVFKPRTSPYSFQGLGRSGLDVALEARADTGLPFVTEIVDVRDIPLLADNVDMLQVGARNMQNYSLLRELGTLRIPVLLKRGLAATVDETLMAAEYILDGGNENVVICERGIRAFESSYRFTLDLTAVTVFQERTHLPVIVDPSHASGERDRVIPLALAAAACGADGIIVESHCDPALARCDGRQALPIDQLPDMMRRLQHAVRAANRSLVLNTGSAALVAAGNDAAAA